MWDLVSDLNELLDIQNDGSTSELLHPYMHEF